MSIRPKSYLKLNRFGVYYFRRAIPRNLKPYFAFRQMSRSTFTRDGREARCLALRFNASIELLFSRIREIAQKKYAMEYAMLEWVDWFNHRRLLEPIGNVPPAEREALYYHQPTSQLPIVA